MPVLLLDTRTVQNAPEERGITDRLYGGDAAFRLKQEIVLGLGGEAVLWALGLEIDTYHLNEGHPALLTTALLRRHPRRRQLSKGEMLDYDDDRVREVCVFTTHTPIEAVHDHFDYDLVEGLLGGSIPVGPLRLIGGQDRFNMRAPCAFRRHASPAGSAARQAPIPRR